MSKEMFKKDKEELQEYLKFKRRRGGMSKIKKGKGSYNRKKNRKECKEELEQIQYMRNKYGRYYSKAYILLH